MMETKKSNYYKEIIPRLISQYKIAVEQCLEIVGQEIDGDLADDKLHAALKGKRMAAEDSKFYAKEIDALENETNNVSNESEVKEVKRKGVDRHAIE